MINKNGFLLIHLMVCIGVLLVIATCLINSSSFMQRFIMRAEIEKLYALFLYLQQYALLTGNQQTITFNTAHNTYQTSNKTTPLAAGIRFGFLPGTYGPPSSPTHPIKQAVTFDKHQIKFGSDGTISSGTLYLTDSKNSFMYAVTTPIAHIPYIRKYYYTMHAWKLTS